MIIKFLRQPSLFNRVLDNVWILPPNMSDERLRGQLQKLNTEGACAHSAPRVHECALPHELSFRRCTDGSTKLYYGSHILPVVASFRECIDGTHLYLHDGYSRKALFKNVAKECPQSEERTKET